MKNSILRVLGLDKRKSAKVFCVGFHKTGTTSLAQALRELGYRVTGPNGVNNSNLEQNIEVIVDNLVPKFDAFQDNPWPVVFRYVDQKYPGSKFILTVRSEDSWINSQVNFFGEKETPMRKWIYGKGCPKGNEGLYLNKYRAHNNEVREYFRDRPNDFIEMQYANGDGWEKLCNFLGKEVPAGDFPHSNKTGTSKRSAPNQDKK